MHSDKPSSFAQAQVTCSSQHFITIILEIMSEEYSEKYCEKYCEMTEDLYELIKFMCALRRRALSDGGKPFCSCCSSESSYCRWHITSSSLVQ